MVDFTIVNPSSHSFNIGRNINNKIDIGAIISGFHKSVGSGLLTTFVSDEFHASGDYSVIFFGSGKFDISVTPQGGLFQVSVALTGTYAGQSRKFLATAKQVDSHTIRFDAQDGGNSLTLGQDSSSTNRIAIGISWNSVGLYVERS